MRIVFWDKNRETYYAVENVLYLKEEWTTTGRPTKIWYLILANGNTKTLKQKDFTVYKVEI